MPSYDLTRLGAQSYSFRKFDLDGALRCLSGLGLSTMEFCAVHFPPDAEDAGFASVLETLGAARVSVPCYGVEAFTADRAANRAKFEFGNALGVECLTADPTSDAFDSLDVLCDEFQIKIAIHNHGPGARYDKVADTLKAIEGHHPYIGACVDTGHAIRSGEKPHEVIEALGPRVHCLHLKDWVHGGGEQKIGEGDLDLIRVADTLMSIGFNGPIVFEYELDETAPVPGMKLGRDNWRRAIGD